MNNTKADKFYQWIHAVINTTLLVKNNFAWLWLALHSLDIPLMALCIKKCNDYNMDFVECI